MLHSYRWSLAPAAAFLLGACSGLGVHIDDGDAEASAQAPDEESEASSSSSSSSSTTNHESTESETTEESGGFAPPLESTDEDGGVEPPDACVDAPTENPNECAHDRLFYCAPEPWYTPVCEDEGPNELGLETPRVYCSSESPWPSGYGVFDVDQDEDDDLIVLDDFGGGPQAVLFRGDPSGVFRCPERHAIAAGHGSLWFRDFTDDDIIDIGVLSGGLLTVLPLDTEGEVQVQVIEVADGIANGTQIDIDGDGLHELVNGPTDYGYYDPPHLARLDDLGDVIVEPFFDPLPVAILDKGDIDEDGLEDLLARDESGRVLWAQSDGSSNFEAWQFITEAYTARLLDFDADGHLDLSLNNGGILLGDGTGAFGDEFNATPENYESTIYPLYTADFDGDGYHELIHGESDFSNDPRLVVMRRDETGHWARDSVHPIYGSGTGLRGDFNGDGVSELIAIPRPNQKASAVLIHFQGGL